MKLSLINIFLLFLFVFLEIVTQLVTRDAGWGSQNQGFGFGLGQEALPGIIYLGLTGGLFIWLVRSQEVEFGWWLILAGGLANSVSRMIMGSVWDYFHWPILMSLWFNSADILIVIGSLMVIVKQFEKGDGKT